MLKHLVCASLPLLLLATASGDIIHVPAALPTIQAGLNAASGDDTVLVAPGTYYENIVWPATVGLNLLSEWGPDSTAIDGSNAGTVITITSGVGSETLISGFTIQHGNATYGGGIRMENSSATIRGNRIVANAAVPRGGGIYCGDGAAPLIVDNQIENNSVPGAPNSGVGGGICCTYAGPLTILRNTISHNFASSRGGAIELYGTPAQLIEYNIIEDNSAGTDGGGIACGSGSSPHIHANTIAGNSAGNIGGAISCSWHSVPRIDYNRIADNSAGWQYSGAIDCGTGSAFPTINHNDICGNTPYGVFNHSAVEVVDAEHNWWNDPDGPGGAGPGGGDRVSSYVDYDPWLTGPAGLEEDGAPQARAPVFFVAQNFPNPFSALTTIGYQLPRAGHTSLRVYDAAGRLIKTILWRQTSAGQHAVSWDARDNHGTRVTPGLYFYTLRAGTQISTKKMLILP